MYLPSIRLLCNTDCIPEKLEVTVMSNLAKKGANSISVSSEKKAELVQEKAAKMNIELSASEVQQISNNISSSFKSQRSMVSEIVKAIKDYLVWLQAEETKEVTSLVSEMSNLLNDHNQGLKANLEEINIGLSQNNEAWASIKENVLSNFSIPN